MKVFISFHRKDIKYKNQITKLLGINGIKYYHVPDDMSFDGWSHQQILQYVKEKMESCDMFLCIVGTDTYRRPHVDNEIHEALKGDIDNRRGIVAVLLEERGDSKNNIDKETFPVKLMQNIDYIVIEQYASINDRLVFALDKAKKNSKNKSLKNNHINNVMALRSGIYYDIN